MHVGLLYEKLHGFGASKSHSIKYQFYPAAARISTNSRKESSEGCLLCQRRALTTVQTGELSMSHMVDELLGKITIERIASERNLQKSLINHNMPILSREPLIEPLHV
jgi:hypothetical protein